MTAATKKVRICLSIDPSGKWQASGGTWLEDVKDPWDESFIEDDLSDLCVRHWIVAEVPIPRPMPEEKDDIVGSVEAAS